MIILLFNFQRHFIGLMTLLAALVPQAALAMASDWDENEHVKVRIVSAVNGVGDLENIPLGLHFQLKPGWKIYWRSPGDAGFPPDPVWDGSENLLGTELSWPAPTRFSILGLETLGYKNEVILPFVAKIRQPGQRLWLSSNIRYLACEEICIPYKAEVVLDVPSGPADPGIYAHLIGRFLARVPGAGDRHGLSITKTVLVKGDRDSQVQIEARSQRPFVSPDVFVEGPDEVIFGKPSVTLSGDGMRAVLAVTGIGLNSAEMGGTNLVLTLIDKDRSMEVAVPLRLGDPIAPPLSGATDTSLWQILLYAILGGLILNLMPCVLPVLSIKLLSVVSYGGRETATVRIGFLSTAAGIVTSMLVIALVLLAVKAAGMSVGWGIQFQQPLFLTFMALVVALFAYNLFDLFEIHVPQRLFDMSPRAKDQPLASGHFLTGVFATLLATPCSAPFVGIAVGFALSRDAVEIISVFSALGAGLALPYLAVATFPRLATALPRPGKWMVVLRQIMGVALGTTAIWLLTVIAVQIGVEGAYALAAMLALVGVVLLIRRLPHSLFGRHAGKLVLVLSIAALAVPVVHTPSRNTIPATETSLWQTFNRAEIFRVVAAGKTVFVDVTADWCITCQINKKVVLDAEPVASWLDSDNVVAMRADWTRPNQDIANYLANFGRFGIPFNAVYGSDTPQGILLPELLTSNIVMQAAAKAGGRNRIVSP